ncbi:protein tyrosine phosphatase family protein [Rhizorhabdus sp.]|jgi:protein tyrosine phosphatase (PTP) superfamily phosphohydrolase (DUF442 family)|uniref:protein tyrosine phosphatase family protein n=1 Tax=Rhizorhabdus sp. TaxID=1968843 RepID=UPI001B43AB27|nr:protein tyrosine phosphatase family protein [Rhizorhabdus sp.]MBP8230669.1 protein tyrosine phosphatase family protein [Rhizorhabdus sp.]
MVTIVDSNDPVSIRAWRRLDERLTTSGQPTEEQLVLLAALGIDDIVNLALHSHEDALEDEATSVAALNMRYHHISVDFAAPTDDDFRNFNRLIDRLEGRTIHVHCILNARVSAFFYRRALESGMDEAAAARRLESIWRPGGVWAAFIRRPEDEALPHSYAGLDYSPPGD